MEMNIQSIVLLAIIIIAFVIAVVSLAKNKKIMGCGGDSRTCNGDCKNCRMMRKKPNQN